MKKWKEEKRLAERRKDFHQGVPAITVIVDGAKQSHEHSYNFCVLECGTSSTACAQGSTPDAKELGSLIEAFKERKHSVRYMRFIGDGGSSRSVHPALLKKFPVWGQGIKKTLVCKPCYRGSLEK